MSTWRCYRSQPTVDWLHLLLINVSNFIISLTVTVINLLRSTTAGRLLYPPELIPGVRDPFFISNANSFIMFYPRPSCKCTVGADCRPPRTQFQPLTSTHSWGYLFPFYELLRPCGVYAIRYPSSWVTTAGLFHFPPLLANQMPPSHYGIWILQTGDGSVYNEIGAVGLPSLHRNWHRHQPIFFSTSVHWTSAKTLNWSFSSWRSLKVVDCVVCEFVNCHPCGPSFYCQLVQCLFVLCRLKLFCLSCLHLGGYNDFAVCAIISAVFFTETVFNMHSE